MRNFLAFLALSNVLLAKADDSGSGTVPMGDDVDEDDGETLLDLELENTPRMMLAPDGTEALVRASAGKINRFGKNNEFSTINIRLEVIQLGAVPEGYEELVPEQVKTIYHQIWLPSEDSTPKQKNEVKNNIILNCEAFGIPYEGKLDIKAFEDQETWVRLGVKKSEQYGDSNVVKSFMNT